MYESHLRRYVTEAHDQAGGGEWADEFVYAGFRRLLAAHGTADDDFAHVLASRYIAISPDLAPAFPDVVPLLDRLAGRYRLAVISNGLARDQRRKIERLDLAGRFDAIVISEEVDLLKPDPAIFLHALRQLGAVPRTTLYVGDHPAHDVAGAHAAGLVAVWLNRDGDGPPRRGPSAAADAEISSLAQLAPLLGLSA